MPKISKDIHSLYVEAGAFTYRPVFPPVYSALAINTTLAEDVEVSVHPSKDGPLATVNVVMKGKNSQGKPTTKTTYTETWFSHGTKGWKPTDFLVW